MKIGIGCITYNRPDHLKHWIDQVSKLSPQDAVFHIANDSKDRKGIAYRSNECLRELYNAGCDYIFLFNDDCFPIKDGWCDYFINASNASEQHHFMYLHETPAVKKTKTLPVIYSSNPVSSDENSGFCSSGKTTFIQIEAYSNCLGVMLFMTRECIEKVGGFSPNFSIYGFEHANYSNRIHKAGLTPLGAYSCPANASKYIYSLDIDCSLPELHKRLKHKGSMSPKEAMHHANKAMKVYQSENQLYYPL